MAAELPHSRQLLNALRDAGRLAPAEAQALADRLASDWLAPIELLRRHAGVSEADLLAPLAAYLGVPAETSLGDLVVAEEFFARVPPEYARAVGVVARALADDHIELAVAPGSDIGAVTAEIGRLFGRPCTFLLAPRDEIERAVDRSVRQRPEYLTSAASELGEGEEFAESARQLERVTDFGELMRKTPVVKLVSLLVAQAVRAGSSDIHFQPLGSCLRVRFRTDGILHDVIELPRSAQDAILTRIKVLGNMDIAERRASQDGRASFHYADHEIDVRMSVVPTDEGERAVLRLFDKHARRLGLDEVGLDDARLVRLRQVLRFSHGMVLVTGPTGSGKTTTLHGALLEINSPEHNIITIEDPVEYKLPGISQIQVQPKKNVTFASMLRHVVRQDPDIIMVGEIRDAETAAMAIQSALTGHLVLSTLHTNDAAGAITRLLDFDIEPFRISSALLLVLAQRLVRRVCSSCGAPVDPAQAGLDLIGVPPQRAAAGRPRRGSGCAHCLNTGYLDRIGIFELLPVDDEIRHLVNRKASWTEVRDAALGKGMQLLREDGAAKVLSGVTTVDEVLRVTQRDTA